VIILLGQLGWFRLADRYNIIDQPNARSSHQTLTIRGGGVVFPLAVLCWFFSFGMPFPWFTAGLFLIGLISLIDDIKPLPTGLRISVHLIAVAFMAGQTDLLAVEWYWWALAFILIIGTINAFNFMDGINAITPFYGLTCLGAFYYLDQQLAYTNTDLILVTSVALLIFSYFNARKKARTFAGDVGSVSLAFILCLLMLQLLLTTANPAYILLFAVYGVDTVLTILHRLLKRENIFQAHRSHLYQYLANELGCSHVAVALLYALLQAAVSAGVIALSGEAELAHSWLLLISVLLLLGILYITTKALIISRLVKANPRYGR
jgi:UDP-N-acetylmuramyl pentapeptide phosphotransferase/UDP-N-acetylglucosamine-1-phosphate transferase